MDILSASRRYHMFEPGDLVVAAVSGGPDSVAMLHALHARSSELGITLHVAHLNHGIRGDESNLDQEFVVKFAQEFGIPATIERVDVPSYRQEMKLGEEEAARALRYKFLQETCAHLAASKIAVAHNANDRAESVLLNIIRGSGTSGLGSIRPIRDNIVRPIIDATRAEVMAYIEENRLPFRVDESNADTAYSRNRIRHDLIPLLEADYNPRIVDALIRLADISLAEDDLLSAAASNAMRSIRMKSGLDAGLLSSLPLALQRRVIRRAIEESRGDLMDVSLEQVDRILEGVESGEDFTITLPSGKLYAVRSGSQFSVRSLPQPIGACEFSYPLQIPGITEIPEARLRIETTLESEAVPCPIPPTELILDMAAVRGELRVRAVVPGDRMIPFGMHSHKKLQDIFVDKKIPRHLRARTAVLADDEKILWVVGVAASEATRMAAKASSAVRLVAAPIRT